MDEFINGIIKAYLKEKNHSFDSLRGVDRIEIPSSFSLHIDNSAIKKKILDYILSKQDGEGYFNEDSYFKDEEKVGGYGAVPTSMAIIALVEGYKKTKEKKYLISALKACDYLYSVEKSGYFRKAKTNKTDVLNTNLLCALALITTAENLSKDSRKKEIFKGAAARSILRSINSQHLSGAYPYTTDGLTVPLLYHSMTLSLLMSLSRYFSDSYLDCSISKGLKYLNSYINGNCEIIWNIEKFKDKTGAVWIYGWNLSIFNQASNKEKLNSTIKVLKSLKGKNYFFYSKDHREEDLFFTALTLFASYDFSTKWEDKSDLTGKIRFHMAKLFNIIRTIPLIIKILRRKLFSYGLDRGAVEYW